MCQRSRSHWGQSGKVSIPKGLCTTGFPGLTLLLFSRYVARFISCYYYKYENDEDIYLMETREGVCLALDLEEEVRP